MGYDEYGSHDNTCCFCKKPIPKYEMGGLVFAFGFVPPTAGRTRRNEPDEHEGKSVKFTQGPLGMTATAVEERCCVPCYKVEFQRVNGVPAPRMPRPVEDDDDLPEPPKVSGTITVSDVEK